MEQELSVSLGGTIETILLVLKNICTGKASVALREEVQRPAWKDTLAPRRMREVFSRGMIGADDRGLLEGVLMGSRKEGARPKAVHPEDDSQVTPYDP